MTTSTSDPRTADLIRQRAVELGFDVCRIADARAEWAASGRLREFVELGRHARQGFAQGQRQVVRRAQAPRAAVECTGLQPGAQNPLFVARFGPESVQALT